MTTIAERAAWLQPWVSLAGASTNERDAVHFLRVGLAVRVITEADVSEDVRADLITLATERQMPRVALQTLFEWRRAIIAEGRAA